MAQVKWRRKGASEVKQKRPPSRRERARERRRRAPATTPRSRAFAHDIRTALTGILALGELLASSNLGERERRWASGIKGSAEHLAALTTLVIDAAKADAGALTLQQEAFRPRRLLEALAQSLAARAETKGLARRSRDRRRFAADAGRRSGAAARGAGKPHRQCGEVHRARRGAARVRWAARAPRGISSSSSPSPTAASGLTRPRSSGCSGRSRRRSARSRAATAAPASASLSSKRWPS